MAVAPCQMLSDHISRSMSSAYHIPTYQHALSSILYYSLLSQPSAVDVLVNPTGYGFTVIDNGNGIHPNHGLDVGVNPHISSQLYHIANISHLRIHSKFKDLPYGFIKIIESGEVVSYQDNIQIWSKSGSGTRVHVRDLFRQFPVRCNAIKTKLASTSKLYLSIRLLVRRIALIHPEIKWSVFDDSRQISLLSTSSKTVDLIEQYQYLFGRRTGNLNETRGDDSIGGPTKFLLVRDPYQVHGLFWPWTRPNSNHVQYLYVNNRVSISEGVASLFKPIVAIGRHLLSSSHTNYIPSYIIVISCPDNMVSYIPSDHAGYDEIWANKDDIPGEISSLLYQAVYQAVSRMHPDIAASIIHHESNPLLSYRCNHQPKLKSPQSANTEYGDGRICRPISWRGARISTLHQGTNLRKRFCRRDQGGHAINRPAFIAKPITSIRFHGSMLNHAKVINQVDDKFIIAVLKTQDDQRLLVAIDQHAADERIRLEELQKVMYDKQDKPLIRDHIVYDPVIKIDWDNADDLSSLDTFREHISDWGYQLISCHDGKYALRTVPVIFGHALNVNDLLEFIHALRSSSSSPSFLTKPPRVNSILCYTACRTAIMFGHHLTVDDCQTLISNLSRCQLPFQCAHGRPSVVPLGKI
uniref:MutL C-terminal dimerisation domain-containing protein n=1 Tax=Spongospora subterranea TaxID=70186 RepID=A0A0H5QVG9_9EUKA|eukprot:CRZ05900.1 hypothetical protein [Spongospora subterranea]